ncbi:hypothetical protein [Massilia timonae]|uniref:hypothetical protein n=1 Tax=Massilia timonae TaxID=47229 RepID=UPI0028D0786D|nr:hypothetical protein [Massilia timonae]
MDQAIARAAGATPSTTPPAAAASRLVGEFQGFVDGIEPSVHWLDRKNMPQVGDRLFAIPAHAAVPRSWSILLTSANHGTVGPLGSTFPHAGEHHERVVVVEVPAAAGAPSDQVNLVLRDASAAEAGAGNVPRDERAAFERHERASNLRRVGVDRDGSGGWYENPCVQSAWEGRRARAEVAAQAGQVAVPEDRQALVNEALSAARELGDREYAHAHSLGKGGPGVKAKVFAAEKRVLAAINALAAPAQAKPLPAAEVPLWDENGEPWNLAAEQIEYERAQASTAGERSQEGGAA